MAATVNGFHQKYTLPSLSMINVSLLNLEIGRKIGREVLTLFLTKELISLPLVSFLACKGEHGE